MFSFLTIFVSGDSGELVLVSTSKLHGKFLACLVQLSYKSITLGSALIFFVQQGENRLKSRQ